MPHIWKELSLLESWFRSWWERLTACAQSIFGWVSDNQGGMIALCALLFLVAIFWIGARHVIMPKHREGSD